MPGTVLSLHILHHKNTECFSALPSAIKANITASTVEYTTVPFSSACSVTLQENVFRISSGEEIQTPSLHAPEKILNKLKRRTKVLTR